MPVNYTGEVFPTGTLPGENGPIPTRWLGRYDGGHPVIGLFLVGDWTIDLTTPGIWLCTAASLVPTWVNLLTSLGLLAANNLSDVPNTQLARVNLGVLGIQQNVLYVNPATGAGGPFNVPDPVTSGYTTTYAVLTGNNTFVWPTPPGIGFTRPMRLILQQDGTGGRTATWPSNTTAPSPTINTSANATTIMDVGCVDGVNFYAVVL